MPIRLNLQMALEELLGSKNVYFQPPESIKLKYPCIIYSLDTINPRFADNVPYGVDKRYAVTIIDRNPDSTIPDELSKWPLTFFIRFYTSNNLNHWVFNMYWSNFKKRGGE